MPLHEHAEQLADQLKVAGNDTLDPDGAGDIAHVQSHLGEAL